LDAALAKLQKEPNGPKQDLTKDLSGYTIEVVGDREVCEKVCQPALRRYAAKRNADAVKGYTYSGESPQGKFSDKRAAVLRSTQAAEGLTLTKQTLDIYSRNDGRGDGGSGDHGNGGGGHSHGEPARR